MTRGEFRHRGSGTQGVAALGLIVVVFASGCGATREAAPPQPVASPNRPSVALRLDRPVTTGTVPGRMVATGSNAFGQLGVQEVPGTDRMRVVRGPSGRSLDGVVAAAAGGRHSIAALNDGRVFAWGANGNGQLGDGTREDSPVPVPVLAPGSRLQLRGAVAVSADTDFSMALMRDGTVVTWGRSDAGQRGVGHVGGPLTPTTVLRPDGQGPLNRVVGIAADGRTAFALLRDGRVLAWGANDFGQVGDGTTRSRALPVFVRGLDGVAQLADVVQVAAGGQHGVALLSDGRVVTWGSNARGQLGYGLTGDRHVPGLVSAPEGQGFLTQVVQISAAERHNFALRSDGTVVGWGTNGAGQLSDGSRDVRGIPAPVLRPDGAPLQDVTRVFAGEAYGVAILRDGSAVTWGANGHGQLGQSRADHTGRPRPVVMEHVQGRAVNAATGERHLLLVVAA